MTGSSDVDAEFMKWLATLGVGGILAAFMFMYYRKDVKQYTELWKNSTDMLVGIIKENTASNTKLVSLIEVLERNALRRADIQELVDKRMRDKERETRNE